MRAAIRDDASVIWSGVGNQGSTVSRFMPLDHGFCPEVVLRRKALAPPDVFAHPRFASNRVVDRVGVRTYAGVPLTLEPSAMVMGTLCFVGTEALPQWTGQSLLQLIKQHRDDLMDLIHSRAGSPRNR